MDIIKALEVYARDTESEYSVGETYESLIWHKSPLPKPTLKDLEKAWEVAKKLIESEKTKFLKAQKYRNYTIPDQLDVLYNEGYEGWANSVKQLKLKYAKKDEEVKDFYRDNRIENFTNRILQLEASIKTLKETKIDMTKELADYEGSLKAIYGFLQLLPEMNKTLLAIQKALEDNNKENNNLSVNL